jgi:hypothetical protein
MAKEYLAHPDDGQIVATVLFALSWPLLFMRIYIKLYLNDRNRRRMKWDDITCISATVSLITADNISIEPIQIFYSCYTALGFERLYASKKRWDSPIAMRSHLDNVS